MTTDDWIKIGIGFVSGGLAGSLYTNWKLDERNKMQPISYRITTSYVNLPKIIKNYGASITMRNENNTDIKEAYHFFEQLTVIQLELTNTGNKDIDTFDFGINIPEGNPIVAIEPEIVDRHHKITYTPEISIGKPDSQVDFTLKPFNREDKYSITLIVNSADRTLGDKIKLSKSHPVKFVNMDAKEQKEYSVWAWIYSFCATLIAISILINSNEKFYSPLNILLIFSVLIAFMANIFLIRKRR